MDARLTEILSLDRAAPALEHDGRWYGYGALGDTVAQIRALLDDVAPAPGARIGVVIRNRPDQFAAILAILASSRCLVVLNPMLPEQRLLDDIATLAMAAVIGAADDLARPGVQAAADAAGTGLIALAGELGLPRLLVGAEGAGGARAGDPAIAVEMLTSGTTGAPKRIPLTRRAFDVSIAGAAAYEKGRDADEAPRLRSATGILSGPISHIGGLFAILSTLLAGRRICLLERFTVEGWRDAVRRHRPKVASVVPAGLRMLLDADIPRAELASLVALRSGTAPLDPAIAREFLARYDLPVLQNYGATEFVGSIAGWTIEDFRAHFEAKPDSTGRISEGVGARIVDPEGGAELPAGEEGVLELRTAMTGQADRWYRTTDRAMIDGDRFLYIRGRVDNAIIRGGFKVHPDEIVTVLEAHPAVREAVVVGIADPRLGQVPAAAILLRAGADAPEAAELHAFARERLTAYQVPARFLIVDALPRTSSMKPALQEVRRLFETQPAAA